MEFPSRAEAKAFRLEFYSFRAAAEREELTKDYPELCAITILVDRSQPTKLKIMHRDNTPNAVALAKALKDAK